MQVVRYRYGRAVLAVLLAAVCIGAGPHEAGAVARQPSPAPGLSAGPSPTPHDPTLDGPPMAAIPLDPALAASLSPSPSPSRLARRPVAQGRAGAPVADRASLAPRPVPPTDPGVLLVPVPVAATAAPPALAGYLIYSGTAALITALGGLMMLVLNRRRW